MGWLAQTRAELLRASRPLGSMTREPDAPLRKHD